MIYSGVPEAYFRRGAKARCRPPRSLRPVRRHHRAPQEHRHAAGRLASAETRVCREEFDLVIAGATGWRSESTVQRLQAAFPDVRYLGYVPEQELPA